MFVIVVMTGVEAEDGPDSSPGPERRVHPCVCGLLPPGPGGEGGGCEERGIRPGGTHKYSRGHQSGVCR